MSPIQTLARLLRITLTHGDSMGCYHINSSRSITRDDVQSLVDNPRADVEAQSATGVLEIPDAGDDYLYINVAGDDMAINISKQEIYV